MKEIPYSVIRAAQNGDTDAIALIRRHFEGYIASKCLVTYDDGDGHSCTFPDDELRYLAEAALYAAIFGFRCKEPPPDFVIGRRREKRRNPSHRETYFAAGKE